MEKYLAHSPTAVFILHSYQELKVAEEKCILNCRKTEGKAAMTQCTPAVRPVSWCHSYTVTLADLSHFEFQQPVVPVVMQKP